MHTKEKPPQSDPQAIWLALKARSLRRYDLKNMKMGEKGVCKILHLLIFVSRVFYEDDIRWSRMEVRYCTSGFFRS